MNDPSITFDDNLTTNNFGNRVHVAREQQAKTEPFGSSPEGLAKKNPGNTMEGYVPGCCVAGRGRLAFKSREELDKYR